MAELTGEPLPSYAAHCPRCGREHRWDNDAPRARAALDALFHDVERAAQMRALLEAAGGKMLGVLVHAEGTLRAYSGDLPVRPEGWCPSVMSREDTAALERTTLATLAQIERETADCDFPGARARHAQLAETPGVPRDDVEAARRDMRAREQVFLRLRNARRRASATLMAAMFDAARLTNGRGERAPLRDVFHGTGIPSGTTECAVPRLLESANRAGLRPLALAEAWWGPTAGGRVHGALQAPCGKCLPILGHLLCGWGA